MEIAGQHLILDGYYKEDKLSNNIDFINKSLLEITDIAGMTIAVPPLTFKYPVNTDHYNFIKNLNIDVSDKSKIINTLKTRDCLGGNGISSTAIWVESHLAIHTWSDDKFLSLDMYSCKNFDVKKVKEYLEAKYQLTEGNFINIIRYKDKKADIKYIKVGEYL